MLRIEFTEYDRQALHHERFHHVHPWVQLKMEVLWLKGHGVPHKDIERLAGISGNTLRSYLQEYVDGGIERLKEIPFRGSSSELEKYKSTVEAHFRDHPPTTSAEAAAMIKNLTGVARSPTQVRTFMRKIGMRCRKVAAIPAKANPQVQETFKKEELVPRLEQAQRGDRVVFFVDAAHFVLGAFLGMLWTFTRMFVRAPSGRQRFNVLGALNAITHELITVTNTAYINAQSVCELLAKIAELNLKEPVTLVLDNARYQRCALVQACATQLGIELLFLPTYSPNLNLIERLWKFTKKKCLYSKYYQNFADFQQAITTCLHDAHQKYKDELDSLLTLHFQTFENAPATAS